MNIDLLLGTSQKSGHKIYLDYLRVLATVFVICVHTVSLAAALVSPGTRGFYVLEILNFSFLSCNLLFIMISGTLLLPVKGERIGSFFCRRFSKVAVPMVVYYILYVCAKEGMVWLYPNHWIPMLGRILAGAPEEAPHFWLIYIMIGLYVLTPFLRWVVQHMKDPAMAWVVVLIFFINAADTYIPFFVGNAHVSVIVDSFVDSFVGVFLLGYFISERCSRKGENILLIGGVLSFLISCVLILRIEGYEAYIFQNSPTMMLYSAAIFILVKRAMKNCTSESLWIRIISRYSFSILLIHWGILHFVVKQILHVDVLSGGIVGGCLLMIVLTLLFSALGAILVEHTLMLFLYSSFGKLSKLCSGILSSFLTS